MQKTVPAFSDNAMFILKKRYFQPGESSEQLLERTSFGNHDYYELMANLEFLPNSPTLFNAGTGHGTLSACFKFDIYDFLLADDKQIFWNTGVVDPRSIAGVMDKALAVQQFGGGVGYELSNLRAKGTPISSTHGQACGPVAVLRYLHAGSHMITQAGKRDAAQMGILSCEHPDLREFIHCKDNAAKIEQMAVQAEQEGDDSLAFDLRNSVLSTFNISVSITDKWMEEQINLGRDGMLWEMAESAWKSGDPGCYFIDQSERLNPTPWLFKLTGTNPCGEVPLGEDEPCNLGSINMVKMLIKSRRFLSEDEYNYSIDWPKLEHTTRIATRFLDDILDHNSFPHPDITAAALLTRKLGLGLMGWADALALLHINYDTEEAVLLAEEVWSKVDRWAFEESVKLGREKGICPAFIGHEEEARRFLTEQGYDLVNGDLPRNATRTCIAPTGTISIIAGPVSGGIEPHFDLKYYHSTAGMIDFPAVIEAKKSGFTPKITEQISHYWHIRHQAAFQKYTNLACSKTINMAEDVTVQDVFDAYVDMWRSGTKGGTIYRNNCRAVQVLNKVKEPEADLLPMVQAVQTNRRRLPDERQAVTHKFKVGDQEGYVTVGLFEDGTPGEMFVTISKEGSTVSGLMGAVAILTSMALQNGVTVDTLTRKMQGLSFEPAGFTNNKVIPHATSMIDYIFHWMRHKFLPDTLDEVTVAIKDGSIEINDLGMTCPDCGMRAMYQEGCLKCSGHCGWSRCG